MAAHEKALIIDAMTNNWNATSAPSAGTTCTASVQPATPTTRVTLTNLGWSLQNATLSTGPACTLSVRHRSIAGSVIASWGVTPVGLGSFQDSWQVNIKGKKGAGISVDWGTPNSSVAQKVSIAGWFDTMSDG